ncbi:MULTISPECIES: hypothetical protein [Microcystis]|uniref:Uncharacterized protein n=1 Tax=Microcystis aeruginosa PCC 9701 TaxID=721123 RepID=I4IRJ4_MICAE|nr:MULTISPECIES: hypothetical protein [Microcystis]MCA2911829.1 hypothetical protein [Microcystis sp. M034S1]TRT64523.1 MAG: hypothetical protein EWV67_09705 [Microcystis sp. M_QC_C_20170808_M2Col]TRT64588.1 MAG: hypothetical protein EWV68_19270 [Microcystis sp. M_QC_C_20170808_M9Col]CCI36918.1 conserved hypothetical protein [Microcystis aeruginosa PCC 9701]
MGDTPTLRDSLKVHCGSSVCVMQFLPILFELERANQLSLLPDKDLADLCPLSESYQVTKSLHC